MHLQYGLERDREKWVPVFRKIMLKPKGESRFYGRRSMREWPRRDLQSAYEELSRWLKETPPDALNIEAGSRIAVPPDRHHLGGLWRLRSPGTADPFDVIRGSCRQRMDLLEKASSSGSARSYVFTRHLSRRDIPPRNIVRRSDLPEPGFPARDERQDRPHTSTSISRHRHRPGRRGKFIVRRNAALLGVSLHAGKRES